jgi:hypothetical protein
LTKQAYVLFVMTNELQEVSMNRLSLARRVQLSTDALGAYVDAVEQAFGCEVDYGQAVKFYDAEPAGAGNYILETDDEPDLETLSNQQGQIAWTVGKRSHYEPAKLICALSPQTKASQSKLLTCSLLA